MTAAPNPGSSNFRSSVILTALLGVVVLIAYVWALFTAQISVLNALGVTGFCLLLLCPAFVAYQVVRLTLQTGTGASVRDYVRSSVRRVTSLLLIDALVAVPLVVLFSLYLQIAITGLYSDAFLCSGVDCPPDGIIHTEMFIPQAISVLVVALGLWSLNLLTSILGAWLALHWQRALPAVAATLLTLTVTVAVIYAVLNLTDVPQLPVDVVAALLPFFLTIAAWRLFAARTT